MAARINVGDRIEISRSPIEATATVVRITHVAPPEIRSAR